MITASQRLAVHRFRHEDAEEVLRDPYPLVDKDLTAEAERARRALDHCSSDPSAGGPAPCSLRPTTMPRSRRPSAR